MDRLDAMTVFVAAATAGSLSAAGRKLRMPLPTVSRKVAELETHLGARLFVRSTRKLALTEAGAAYLADCRRILAELEQAERDAAGEYQTPRGELTLTAPVSFGRLHVMPVVSAFLKEFPRIDVRLQLSDRSLDLIDERLDAAVRIGVLPDSRLVAVRLAEMRTLVCASPAYLKERGTPQSPDELASHDCVSFASITGAATWSFKDRRSVSVHSRLSVNTAEAAVDGAIAGLGLVRALAYQVAEAVRGGKLRIVLQPFEVAPVPVSLLYTREARQTAKLKAFVDFAVSRLRKAL